MSVLTQWVASESLEVISCSNKKHDRENRSIRGVCLVVLGLRWGPLGSGMWGLPLPDVD